MATSIWRLQSTCKRFDELVDWFSRFCATHLEVICVVICDGGVEILLETTKWTWKSWRYNLLANALMTLSIAAFSYVLFVQEIVQLCVGWNQIGQAIHLRVKGVSNGQKIIERDYLATGNKLETWPLEVRPTTTIKATTRPAVVQSATTAAVETIGQYSYSCHHDICSRRKKKSQQQHR